MKSLIPTLLLVLLSACATRSSVMSDSQKIAETKGYGAAVEHLKQANAKDPNDTEARMLLQRYRWHWLLQLGQQADAAFNKGELDKANTLYTQILKEEPNNNRAQEGLNTIRQGYQHGQWLLEAQDAQAKGQMELALATVNRILAEDPRDTAALSVKSQIDEIQNRSNMTSRKLKTAFKKKITLEFRDQSLRSIFEVISRTAGINFIFDKDVPPDLRTTIFARNTTAEDAIRVLLATNRLERKLLSENTLMIYQATPDKLRDNQELVTKAFYVANADISKTMNLIKLMVKTNDVYVDERLNMIVMRDTPEAIRVAEKLIAAHDLPDPEVVLEIEVLELTDTHTHDIGVKLPTEIGLGIPGISTTKAGETTTSPLTLKSVLGDINSNSITVSGLDKAMTIKLKEEDGASRVLANPKIRIRNKEKAKILIGEKVPIFTVTSVNNSTSSNVQYQDVGLTVRAEPTIHADGNVSIRLYLEVSKLGELVTDGGTSGGKAYRIDSRVAETVLRLKDGETQMLAGLIRNEERSSFARVPGLGDIPILGRLFGATASDNARTEIVLLITPRVVRSLQRPAAYITEFSSGTATQLTDQPLYLDNTDSVSPQAAQPGQFPAPTTPAAPTIQGQ